MSEYPRPNKELIENAPNTVKYKDLVYYKDNQGRYCRCGVSLSRVIWEDAYGKIPEGYEVHHKDRNPTNNALSNLECLSQEQHIEIHKQLLTDSERAWYSDNVVVKANPKASEWHKSDAGHVWHINNTKHQHEIGAFTHKLICSNCGKEYIGKIYSKSSPNFCSGKCKSAYRRKSGVDDEIKVCQYCGKEFIGNKRKQTKTCSKECRYKLLSETLRGN